MMDDRNIVEWFTSLVAFFGGVNMAAVGFLNYDLFANMFGTGALYHEVLVVVAVSTLYFLASIWYELPKSSDLDMPVEAH